MKSKKPIDFSYRLGEKNGAEAPLKAMHFNIP